VQRGSGVQHTASPTRAAVPTPRSATNVPRAGPHRPGRVDVRSILTGPRCASAMSPMPTPAAGHASIVHTVPSEMSPPPPLACRREHAGSAPPPTTTVSANTNHLSEEVSVGRRNCEAAAAGFSLRHRQRHSTWLQAPPHRDRTLGRAAATPASAGSPTIPRPKSTRTEQGQRHVGVMGCQGERGETSSARERRPPPT
jgi:hypothetical protein